MKKKTKKESEKVIIKNEVITEQVEEVKAEEVDQPKDPKIELLEEFAMFCRTNITNRMRTNEANGRIILNYFNKYTNRAERYTNCTSCIAPKFNWLLAECKKKGVVVWTGK